MPLSPRYIRDPEDSVFTIEIASGMIPKFWYLTPGRAEDEEHIDLDPE